MVTATMWQREAAAALHFGKVCAFNFVFHLRNPDVSEEVALLLALGPRISRGEVGLRQVTDEECVIEAGPTNFRPLRWRCNASAAEFWS